MSIADDAELHLYLHECVCVCVFDVGRETVTSLSPGSGEIVILDRLIKYLPQFAFLFLHCLFCVLADS